MSIVSNNIKYLRRVNGLTQEQFSRKIGIKRASVGAYEEARANPPIDILKRMADLFGTTVDALVKNDLRKIRETPGLNKPIGTAAPIPPSPLNIFKEDEKDKEPIVDTPKHISTFASIVLTPPVPPQNPIERKEEIITPKREEPVYQLNNTDGMAFLPIRRITEYLLKYNDSGFVESLPKMALPMYPRSDRYRAFEVGSDFPLKNSIVIGEKISEFNLLKDGRAYLLVVRNQGLLYRRVFNQIAVKGSLLLSADVSTVPSLELPYRDVLEYWEVKSFFSQELPKPNFALNRVSSLAEELQSEIEQMQKDWIF
jgi:transcriptional regulator with XRE-family HTH domain